MPTWPAGRLSDTGCSGHTKEFDAPKHVVSHRFSALPPPCPKVSHAAYPDEATRTSRSRSPSPQGGPGRGVAPITWGRGTDPVRDPPTARTSPRPGLPAAVPPSTTAAAPPRRHAPDHGRRRAGSRTSPIRFAKFNGAGAPGRCRVGRAVTKLAAPARTGYRWVTPRRRGVDVRPAVEQPPERVRVGCGAEPASDRPPANRNRIRAANSPPTSSSTRYARSPT